MIRFETTGLSWKDENTTIVKGNKKYIAKYTRNNDTKNYTTKEIEVLVYGKALIRVNTRVNGEGGSVSNVENEVLEGEEVNIRFNPEEGYEIEKVTLNGREVRVTNNELTYTAGDENINIVVTYKKNNTDGEDNPNENNNNTNTNTNNNTNNNNTNINTNSNVNNTNNNYTNSNSNTNNNINTNSNSNRNSNAVSVASVGNIANSNTVQSASTSNNKQDTTKEKTPSTGTNITIYIILAITSFVGFISTFIYKRKGRSNIY